MKKPSPKCIECAKIADIRAVKPKPSCYAIRRCARLRSYYRHHERNKKMLRDNHIYLKYADDHCAMCDSKELLEVHHVKPQILGASHTRMNSLTLCYHCHKVITKYYNIVLGRLKDAG